MTTLLTVVLICVMGMTGLTQAQPGNDNGNTAVIIDGDIAVYGSLAVDGDMCSAHDDSAANYPADHETFRSKRGIFMARATVVIRRS